MIERWRLQPFGRNTQVHRWRHLEDWATHPMACLQWTKHTWSKRANGTKNTWSKQAKGTKDTWSKQASKQRERRTPEASKLASKDNQEHLKQESKQAKDTWSTQAKATKDTWSKQASNQATKQASEQRQPRTAEASWKAKATRSKARVSPDTIQWKVTELHSYLLDILQWFQSINQQLISQLFQHKAKTATWDKIAERLIVD